MSKNFRAPDASGEEIDAAAVLARMLEITGASSQTELADILGVGKAAISDAKTRGAVPASWLLKLSRSPYNANPVWLELGLEPRRIQTRSAAQDSTPPLLRAAMAPQPEAGESPVPQKPQQSAQKSSTSHGAVPVARLALAARGDALALDGAAVSPFTFAPSFLESLGDPSSMRLVGVEHDGAVPGGSRGDWLLVDESRTDILEGALHVLRLGPDVVVRRIRRKADEIVLLADEREECLPAIRHGLDVLGVVVWAGRKMP
ncbi:helix-turn-helix domain-containing protein [Oceanidesulfovibrio marinus]|uniref:Bacteriophage CI repressor N-terminal domain-containing protein n=1 Tax=Oceanidesulfovibrio marinus TaxID=370038 RepID=A0A6P1ZJY3_9BACT|nr:helix-turn-helix domain-containing protein [Oceanidesulfovibrio marinus]TVM34089.1 hypothetical protein DQK91_09295 [Oceanidesulfovibrio marinus]